MNVYYVYSGQRDSGLEETIRGRLKALCGEARQLGSESGQGGMTTVTLALDKPMGEVHAVVEALRGHPRVIDAAEGSLGEGA